MALPVISFLHLENGTAKEPLCTACGDTINISNPCIWFNNQPFHPRCYDPNITPEIMADKTKFAQAEEPTLGGSTD